MLSLHCPSTTCLNISGMSYTYVVPWDVAWIHEREIYIQIIKDVYETRYHFDIIGYELACNKHTYQKPLLLQVVLGDVGRRYWKTVHWTLLGAEGLEYYLKYMKRYTLVHYTSTGYY